MPEEKVATVLQYSLRQPKVRIRRPPLLVLLHGVGSNDHEFMKIAEHFDERFLIASLRAPFSQTADSSNWFSMNWTRSNAVSNAVQAEYSRGLVINFLNQVAATLKADPTQVHLLGHSQGAVIALMTILSRPDLVASAAAINGHILPEVRSIIAPAEKLREKPILLIQGVQDVFYPISLGRSASAMLATLPVNFKYFEFYTGHALTPESVTRVNDWCTQLLDAQGILGVPQLPEYQIKLAAIHLRVHNLERSISFYARYLGMELTEQVGKGYAFLTNDKSHHHIVLLNVGPNAPDPHPKSTGLDQISFEVPDQETFFQVYRTLQEGKIPIVATDHMISWGLRFSDPDGHEIEVFWDNRDQSGRSHLWQGRDLPLEIEKLLATKNSSQS